MIDRTVTMQEACNQFKTYQFHTMHGDEFNQETMDDIGEGNKIILQDGGDSNQNQSDTPVDVFSVPIKLQDGNANFQYEVSPTPGYAGNRTTAPLPSNQGSSFYISPMPPTPSTQTPSSSISKDANTLAALYHSSRRSRHDSSPMPASTSSAAAISTSSRQGFLPPPPLATASPKPELSSFNCSRNDAPATSSNENWSASVDSTTGFAQPPPLYNCNSTNESQAFPTCNVQAGVPQGINDNDAYLTPLVPAKQTVSMLQFEFTPSTTMDRQLLDLANESSANMLSDAFEQLPKFTRSRTEFEGQDEGTDAPSSKKLKSDTAYNLSKEATPEISSLGDDVEESILSLLALSKNEYPLKGEMVARHDKVKEAATVKRNQDVIRRKVQRLLLIRHATRCKAPLPASEYNADGSSVCTCPVSSHCAIGKRLASHIRKCRDVNCQYKWCLTTRDVLSHYKSCRDRKCEICGPVRAMHRREEQQVNESNENNEQRVEMEDKL